MWYALELELIKVSNDGEFRKDRGLKERGDSGEIDEPTSGVGLKAI